MKYFSLIALFLLANLSLDAQTNAITEHGDSVVLLENGKWEFIENYRLSLLEAPLSLDTNAVAFFKPESAKRITKSMEGHYNIWYTEKDWQETDPKALNPIAEKAFVLEGNSAYGMVIYEKVQIPLEQLKNIAVANAERMGENVKVLNTEYRKVNEKLYLAMEMNATVMGLDMRYVYYFANKNQGCLQFITFTTDPEESTKDKLYELLNGLIVKD